MGKAFASLYDSSDKDDHENDYKLNDSEHIEDDEKTQMLEFIIAHEYRTIEHSTYYEHLKHKIHSISSEHINGYPHCKIKFKSYSDELYVLTHLLYNERIVYNKQYDNIHKIFDYKNNTLRIGKIKKDYKIIERDGIWYWSHPRYDCEYLKLIGTDPSSLFSFEFAIILQQIVTQVLGENHISISTSIRANKWSNWLQMVDQIVERLCNQFVQQQRKHMLSEMFKCYREPRTFLKDVDNFVKILNEGREDNIINAVVIRQCFAKKNISYDYFDESNLSNKKYVIQLLKLFGVTRGVAHQIWNKFAALKTSRDGVEGIINSCINGCNFVTFTDKDTMKLLHYTNWRHPMHLKEISKFLKDIKILLPNRPIKLLEMYKHALVSTGWDENDVKNFYKSIAKNRNLDYFKNKYDTVETNKSTQFCNNWLNDDSCKYSKPWSNACWEPHEWDRFQVKFENVVVVIKHALKLDFLSKHKSKRWSKQKENDDMKMCDSYSKKVANIAAYITEDQLKSNALLKNSKKTEPVRAVEYGGYITPDLYYPSNKRPIIDGKRISAIENKGRYFGVAMNTYDISKKNYDIYCGDTVIYRAWKYVIAPPGIWTDPWPLIKGIMMTETQFKDALDNRSGIYAEIVKSNANDGTAICDSANQTNNNVSLVPGKIRWVSEQQFNDAYSYSQSDRYKAYKHYLSDNDISSDEIGHETKKFKNIRNKSVVNNKKKKSFTKKHKQRKQRKINDWKSEN